MEESLPASLLVLAGLLRLAGVSQSEPWSSHLADQTSLEEGLVTTETLPASASDTAEATLQLDHFTSTLAAADVSHSQEASGTQAEGVTEDEDQLLTILATARQTERSEQSLGAAVSGHQSDVPFASKPSTGTSALTGAPESKADSSSLSKHLAKFLPREEEAGNSTAGGLLSVEWSTPIPSKELVVEPLATQTLSSDSSESAGQQVTLSTSHSPAVTTGNLHRFTLINDSTAAEELPGQISRTSAKESPEKLLTLIPESSESSQVKSQPAKSDIGSSDVFRTGDLLTQAQRHFLKIGFSTISQQTLLEEPAARIPRTKMAQHSSSGEMKEHKPLEQGKTENPTLLAPSESNTRPLPFLSTPGTLSLKTSPQSAFSGDQSGMSKLVFSSQFPSFSQSAASTRLEKHIHECVTLHHETDRQTATQASLFKLSQTAALLSEPLPVSQMKETTIAVSVPADSKSRPSGVLPPVHDKRWGRVPSMTPMANLISSHVRSTMLAMAAPSKVGSPSLVASAAATPTEDVSQALSNIQLPASPSSVYREQPFPSLFVPSLTDPEPVVASSATDPTKQQTPVIHSGLKRLAEPTPSPIEPVVISALAHTKSPIPGVSASWRAGLSTSAAIDSAPSRLKPPALSTLADGEVQESMFGLRVPYQADQRMLGDSASTHTRSTTPGTFPPHVQSDVSGASVVPRLSVLSTSALNHLRQKLSTVFPLPRHARTPSLLAQAYAKSRSPATPVPSVSIPDMNAPSHVKSQVPGSAASFIDDSHVLVTSVPTLAKPKTNEAPVQSRLPASTDIITPQRTSVSVSTHTKVQSLIFSASTEHALSDVSAKLGAQLHKETEVPKSSSSPPVHHQLADMASHGQLKPEPSSTSAFVDTSDQLPEPSTSANTGTQTPSISIYVHPGLSQHATTPVLSGVHPHTLAKVSEGKHSAQSSPPTSQNGTYQAALVGVSPLPLRRSSPRLGNPASQVSHHNEVKLPFVSGTLEEERPPGLRTTPVLAVPDAQGLVYSSLSFNQPFNQSDVPAARSLSSPAAGEYHGMPPSFHYLSVLVRNAENMVCLQPVQDATTPPSGEPNASGRGVASAQEMLLWSSSSSGFPHLGASGLVQMSPSSVILVKPVLVFLPADKPEVPVLSSAEEEEEHKASLLFTNKTFLGLVTLGGSQEQPVEASPTLSTIRNPSKANTLSANTRLSEKQVISGPVLNASLKSTAEASQVRSSCMTTVPSRYGMKDLNTRTQSLKSKNRSERFPSSALDSQEPEENNPVLLPVGSSVKHQVSVIPRVPVVVALQQRPKLLPASSSLYSLVEPSGRLTSSFLASRATERPQQGRRMFPVLHTETGPPGSVTPLTSLGKNTEGPLRASSTGNTELPLEREQFTLSRPTLQGSSSTTLMGKLPGSTQSILSVVSDFLVLSNEQKHQVSEALNYARSEAILEFPLTTEMSSYRAKATSSKPSKPHPKTPMANEGLRSPPLFTLSSADPGMQTTGDRLEGIKNHQVLSIPPADIPSYLSVSSHFAKPTPKHNLTPLVVSGRASLTNMEDHIERTEITEETNERVRVTEIHHQTEATSSTPTTFGSDSGYPPTLLVAELNAMAGLSYGTRQPGGVQRGVRTLSPAPFPWLAPNSARKDVAVSPMSGKTSLLERAALYRTDPTTSGTSKEQDTPLKHRGGQHGGIAAHSLVSASFHLQPISLEGDHLERPRLFGDDQAQKASSSLPRPGGTSSSLLSIALNASTFLMTTLSSGAGTDGAGQISDQTPHLQSLPLDASETFLNLHTQIWPTSESVSEASAERALSVDATGESESRSYTMGEQVTDGKDAAGGAEDPVAALQPRDSNGKAHLQRLLRSDDVFLDGLAVVSDDSCSSGNYTTEMSLQPGAAASSPDSFLALITVQGNSSEPTLRIESCCVTPTSRPTGSEAACCLFPRSPLDCGHIQFHQNGQSGMASFTIQLFQMLNLSMVYLHCELSVCLSKQGGCERGCLENREALPRLSDRSGYQTRHNLISFGPVWKAQAASPSGSAAGPDMAAMLPFLLGSLTGTALLMGIAIFIWLHRKCKTKMADGVESRGSCAP